MSTGIFLISQERERQILEEKWTIEHDDEHTDGSLALVATCYASPIKIFQIDELAGGLAFIDPWPDSWLKMYDKRMGYGERKKNPGNVVPNPHTYNKKERLDLLVKAGALIAAEIDRLNRKG